MAAAASSSSSAAAAAAAASDGKLTPAAAAAAAAAAKLPVPLPNILITGTPGTGKTTTAEMLAELTKMRHINVGDLIKEKDLHDGRDEKFDTFILNEDKVCDEMEDIMSAASRGVIVDFHTCDFFPERWFDLVVVLRTDNTVLHPRLVSRGYNAAKIEANIEAEIFRKVLDDAVESYPSATVKELTSETVEQMESNVEWIAKWIQAYVRAAAQANIDSAIAIAKAIPSTATATAAAPSTSATAAAAAMK